MAVAIPIRANERGRFAIVAMVLAVASFTLQTNETTATSGLVAQVGTTNLPWVWTFGLTTVLVTSALYSLVVDRMPRGRLAIWLFGIGATAYLALAGLMLANLPPLVTFGAYYVLIVQHFALAPLIGWSLANDAFQVGDARRVFPILAAVMLVAGFIGNLLIGLVPLQPVPLLVCNAFLSVATAIAIPAMLQRSPIESRQSPHAVSVKATFAEGFGFIKDVPAFRYLALGLLLSSAGITAMEYGLLTAANEAFPTTEALQRFYGIFKAVVTLALLIVQIVVAPRMLQRFGFKPVFWALPLVLVFGLVSGAIIPIAAFIGSAFTRIVLMGLDTPARKAFQGLVPDERRGRVSAFLDGIVYTIGGVLGSVTIGLTTVAIGAFHRSASLLIIAVGALIAVGSIALFHRHYDTSMLNWRLQQRRRVSRDSVLAKLDF